MKDNKDYNNVNENSDIEMGSLFKFGNYICEVDDFNDDNINESIIYIYESKDKYNQREYLEQISLNNKNIKDNIEDYMIQNYTSKISRLSLLLEIQDQLNYNLFVYSKNYLMTAPKDDCKAEWAVANQKCKLISEMIKEEKNRSKRIQKISMER